MYWQEDDNQQQQADNEIVDLVCSISCRSLPVDHAHALAEALLAHAGWLQSDNGAGIHPISIQEAGNGWMRPEGADELLHLSRRTKLILRTPRARLDDAEQLKDRQFDVAGNVLTIQKMDTRELQAMDTLFSRYNILAEGQTEEDFMKVVFEELKNLGISPRKMLPGRSHVIRTPAGELQTSSLMVADLKPDESIALQQRGIGEHQHLGCGLFVPHKGIREVHDLET